MTEADATIEVQAEIIVRLRREKSQLSTMLDTAKNVAEARDKEIADLKSRIDDMESPILE